MRAGGDVCWRGWGIPQPKRGAARRIQRIMQARQVIVMVVVLVVGFAAGARADAVPKRPPDAKLVIHWWTRATAPDTALFDSLDAIAWPVAKACFDSTAAADWARSRRRGPQPKPLERSKVGPLLYRENGLWVVSYCGGPMARVIIGRDGKVVWAEASVFAK